MIYATEASDKLRAMISDIRGKYDKKNWEHASARETKCVWMTDCQSLHYYLINPIGAGSEDKRLEIDLESLRECLWEHPSGRPKDEITDAQTDKPRWIDTSTMLCDPLTKAGPKGFAQRLIDCMQSGHLSLEPTAESQMKKLQQQKRRMQKTLEKQETSNGQASSSNVQE